MPVSATTPGSIPKSRPTNAGMVSVWRLMSNQGRPVQARPSGRTARKRCAHRLTE